MEVEKHPDDEAHQDNLESSKDQNIRTFSDQINKMALQQKDLTSKCESEMHIVHSRSSHLQNEDGTIPRMDRTSAEFDKSFHYSSHLDHGSAVPRNSIDRQTCNPINRQFCYNNDPTNRQILYDDPSNRQLSHDGSMNRHDVPINCHRGHNFTIDKQLGQNDTINRQSGQNDTINGQIYESDTTNRLRCDTVSKHVDQSDTISGHMHQCGTLKSSIENSDVGITHVGDSESISRGVFQGDSNTRHDAIKSSVGRCDFDDRLSEKICIKRMPTPQSDTITDSPANYESSDAPRLKEGQFTKQDSLVKSYESRGHAANIRKTDKTYRFEEQSISTSHYPQSNTTTVSSSASRENQNMITEERSVLNSSPTCQVFANHKTLVNQSTQTNSSGDIITLNSLFKENAGVQASVFQCDTETQTFKLDRKRTGFPVEPKYSIGNTVLKRQPRFSKLKKRTLNKRKRHRKTRLEQDDDDDDADASPAKRTRNHLNRSVKQNILQVLPAPDFEDVSDKDDSEQAEEDKNCSDYDPDVDEKKLQKPKSHVISKPDSAEKITLRQRKPFKCPFCHKRFIKETSLENHTLNSCTKNRRGTDFICSECGDHFSLFSVYRKHLKSHVGEFYKCVCGEKFENYLSLKCHIENELKSNEGSKHDEVHPYSCSICLKTFIHQGRYKRHMITHENNSKIACSVCGKEFEKGYMEIHERIHTGHKPFVCQHPDCTMSYTSKKLLQRHERIHVEKYQLPCSHCDKVFTQTSRLKDHLRVHTGEKPYICEICGFAFSRTNHLNRHKLLHVKQQAVSEARVSNDHLHDFSKLNTICR